MVSSSTISKASALSTLAFLLAACSNGGGTVGNTSPRVGEIPQQRTAGGTALSLDVSAYVTDRENGTLTYSVVAGGGSFTGGVYSNMFAAMGAYTVSFKVADEVGNETPGSFDVDVTSSDFAVVTEDTTGLLLLDTDTNSLVTVAQSALHPVFATGLDDGRMVFQKGQGAGLTLSIFDPFTRQSRQIAAGEPAVTYRDKTSDGRLVFTTGTGLDTDLYLFNPRTNLITELSATDGETDGNAMVSVTDLVFYERGDNGQADIYYYNPATDRTTAVGTDPNDERLLAVLPNGAAVFSRVGAGGEHDLFYFERGSGLVEIGVNTPALGPLDKAGGGVGKQGQVVFTAQNGVDVELWSWDPSNGIATQIAAGGVFAVAGIGDGNELVYRHENSASDHDLHFYDLDDGTTGTVRNSTDLSTLLVVTSDGTTSWAIVQGNAATSTISAVSLQSSPVTVNWAAGGVVEFSGLLQNGDVVARRTDGTAIARFDVSAGAWGAPINGAGITYGGPGVDDGDFVYALTVSAQQDLSMWDESAGAPVVVSDTPGLDTYRHRSLSGTILFTRVVGTNTNHDLFAWAQTPAETQITSVDGAGLRHNYNVVDTYTGTR